MGNEPLCYAFESNIRLYLKNPRGTWFLILTRKKKTKSLALSGNIFAVKGETPSQEEYSVQLVGVDRKRNPNDIVLNPEISVAWSHVYSIYSITISWEYTFFPFKLVRNGFLIPLPRVLTYHNKHTTHNSKDSWDLGNTE